MLLKLRSQLSEGDPTQRKVSRRERGLFRLWGAGAEEALGEDAPLPALRARPGEGLECGAEHSETGPGRTFGREPHRRGGCPMMHNFCAKPVAMQTHKGPVATALTDRQAGLLDYLRQYAREYDGRLPSLYRMRGDMGMGVGQLYSTLDKLVVMGYLETDKDGTYRSIRLAEERP